MKSLAERQAALQAARLAFEVERDYDVEQLETKKCAVQSKAERGLAALRSAFDAESRRVAGDLVRAAHPEFVAAARAFAVEGSRAAALAYGEAWARLDADWIRVIGARHGWGAVMGGLALRSFLVFADLRLEKDPGALPAFVSAVLYGSHSAMYEVVARANAACMSADAPTIAAALEELEKFVAHVAQGNRAQRPDDSERWNAIRFAGSVDLVEQAIAELDKARDAEVRQQLDKHIAAEHAAREEEKAERATLRGVSGEASFNDRVTRVKRALESGLSRVLDRPRPSTDAVDTEFFVDDADDAPQPEPLGP